MGHSALWNSLPKIYEPESRTCRASGNHHGLIHKYGLMYRRQCFPSNGNELGFIKRQDVWSLQVSNRRIDRPLHNVSHRYNVFMCRSFGIPISGREIPVLKYTTSSLTRSFNALRESPLVLQLGPAVGIIIFAAWGLGPLMRYSRNLFLHKNESSWKKSKTHYVFISYLQPLLLWTGATIVCRVLDPVVLPSEASQAIKQRLLNFVRSLSTVLAFTYCLSSFIQQTQNFFKESSGSDDKRKMGFQFAGKTIYTAVWVAAFSLFMELLGFSTQKWVTAGGLGTVLLTLAGREIFTNFLSSVMIHATRPFVMNEWIQTKIEGYEVSGTVEHVGWWSPSIIRGEDREAVHIPNHKFTVSVVRNLTQKSHWRIKTHLAISHLDVNKINNIVADMRKVIAKNPQIEQQRLHRRVFLDNIDPENQALLILVSCFVKTSHFEEYLCVKEAILLDLLRVISHHRARLATPIRTVQKVYGDADIENIPFADTIFARAGAAASRPILLIEPSPRINGDDKAKPRQVPRGNDEQNTPKGNAASENKTTPAVSEATVPNNSEKHQRKKGSADTSTQPSLNSASKKAACETSPPSEDVEPIDGVDAVSVNPKNEGERLHSARPTAFEDNIVLGVAIEGSKRTLPIEERMVPPPAPVEASELAAGRGGSPTSPASPTKGATVSDHRDQER